MLLVLRLLKVDNFFDLLKNMLELNLYSLSMNDKVYDLDLSLPYSTRAERNFERKFVGYQDELKIITKIKDKYDVLNTLEKYFRLVMKLKINKVILVINEVEVPININILLQSYKKTIEHHNLCDYVIKYLETILDIKLCNRNEIIYKIASKYSYKFILDYIEYEVEKDKTMEEKTLEKLDKLQYKDLMKLLYKK